jgi:hypothetical protein
MPQQARHYVAMAAAALLCGGCALPMAATVAASMATSTGTHLAWNKYGESKSTRAARAAFERAPWCSTMSHGVQNGRVITVVNDVAWFDAHDSGDGRPIEPRNGNRLVMVDYRIDNRSDGEVIVTPRRLTVSDAAGKVTNAKDGVGGIPAAMATPDEAAVLTAGGSWSMASVFEVPPGEYALMVPNGRVPGDPEPTWVDGCRFAGPVGSAKR